MIIKTPRKSQPVGVPLLHEGHKRPVTRREFLGAGLISGGVAVWTPNLLGLLLPRSAQAAPTLQECGIGGTGETGTPFICFDLGGGANMAGSNVLVGATDGNQDAPLSTAGYNKLGLPDDKIPGRNDPVNGGNFVNTTFGLNFHSDSAFLRGMLSRTSALARDNVNGVVIPARSDNDTGNNPHNPMYLIARAREMMNKKAKLMELIGSENSDSGGRSMAGTLFLNSDLRPTKIASRNDSVGLVDTGGLKEKMQLTSEELGAIADTIAQISNAKVDRSIPVSFNSNKLMNCAYHKASDNLTSFQTSAFDPLLDTDIFAGLTARPGGYANNQTASLAAIGALDPAEQIFTNQEITGNGTFRKTAAAMQMVMNGHAGAATVALGGYDYHDSTRATGERRDFEAGAAIGATIEYAHRKGTPVMIYVFTDGSLASNGAVDTSADGRDKGQWTGDNSSTSASFMLVYNPTARPTMQKTQLVYFRSSGSVETVASTPGANNVDSLAQMVALNYIALSSGLGAASQFNTWFDNGAQKHTLGSVAEMQGLIGFNALA